MDEIWNKYDYTMSGTLDKAQCKQFVIETMKAFGKNIEDPNS